jgi:hypothetical protein
MTLGCRPHQCCLVTRGLGGVGIRAVGEQCLDRIDRASPGGGHERGFSVRLRRIRIGAGLEQEFD